VKRLTINPLRGKNTMSPCEASSSSASLTGVREIPRSAAIAFSLYISPIFQSPESALFVHLIYYIHKNLSSLLLMNFIFFTWPFAM
jgi:hypothetical protein